MTKTLKLPLIILVMSCFYHNVFCQVENEATDINDSYKHSFFTGGNLGLQFGTVTMIDVSPQFGYYIFENMSVGLGLTYQYINDHRFSETMHVIGGRVFTRLYLPFYNSVFAHAEFEYMAFNTNVFSMNGQKEWIELSNVLAGVGYRQRIGGRSSINLMVLWNFNETPYTLYSNPVIRMGVDIGF
jgi:long-subunit fatty acid transport protein